ncbi:GatB/YqeY domain-containing protein, partial [Patescibacteria group bacterium]
CLEFEKGERKDLAEKEKAEIEILNQYLPEQISKEEIEKLAREIIEKIGAKEIKDMGKVMAELMPKVKGKTEGGEVGKVVKELLTGKE